MLVEDRFAVSEVVGALTRLDNRAGALPGHLAELQQRRAGVDDRIAAARETADRPFLHRHELQEARTAVEKVRARLAERYSEVEELPTDVPPAAGPAAAPVANPLAAPPAAAAGRLPSTCIALDPRGEVSAGDSCRITLRGRKPGGSVWWERGRYTGT
ncbi:MAG TPA: hypothetical protein VGV93_00795 [Acidimicrobiales bacterium]|nr:hypothetical protein [Acidimicrobiales bacterium]